MTKIILVFFALVACIQIIKPLGWPGLEHRRDAWKLAAAAFAIIVALLALTALF